MAQRFLNGVFKETWTHTCLKFDWFSFSDTFISSSFLSYLFFLCVSTKVRVCLWMCVKMVSDEVWNLLVIIFTNNFSNNIYAYTYIHMYVCLFQIKEKNSSINLSHRWIKHELFTHTHIHTHTNENKHTYICLYIYTHIIRKKYF